MAFLTMLLFLAPVLLLWAFVVHLIPAALRDTFSHKLDTLHNHVLDEIAAGSYQNPERAKLFVQQIESLNQQNDDLSPGKIMLLRSVAGNIPAVTSVKPLAGLGTDDEERLKQNAAELLALINRHARFETLSGWLTLGLWRQPIKPKDVHRLLCVGEQRERPEDALDLL